VSIARLAAVSALEGRVMLIDGDLRRPAVAPEMGLKAEKGLIHYFSGQAPLEDIIVEDPLTGVHAILAAPGTPNPPELLNSTHMRALLDKLSRSYDTIVIDSPALSEVSDALVLAHLADATVYVVQWESTPRHIAIESYKHLLAASARIAGVVLQKVNVRRSSAYAYEES
jgi:capsular exopolysaccharide synthesis family protein